MSKHWAWLAPAALIADRAAKQWAVGALADSPGRTAVFWPGVALFHYVENTGAAFSMLAGRQGLLIATAAAMVLGVAAYLIFARKPPALLVAGLSLMAAGGLGNLIDRATLGYVIDFIEFEFVRFAVFNVADVCVTTGAALAILRIAWMEGRRDDRKRVAR
ncbi:MAG: signal peptidase II [Clostridiales bacterium]|nr:signal peptidase II [Clostridiales bacterium]